MKNKILNDFQKEILRFLQKDLPLEMSPYAALAEKLNTDETAIIREIKRLKAQGYIRRFGAILNHRKVGLNANCMCVWNVPEQKISKVAKLAIGKNQISHCYLRKISKKWSYNFYTMIHGRSKQECFDVVADLLAKTGVDDYKMLFTKKQFKKTSPEYRL
ncbi:MAG: Lrp/AsnC family transcriptional regulator [PVC group bacterium]|nr:Lrp/AsnC family transcriptional regulator [PVC group bacterium]